MPDREDVVVRFGEMRPADLSRSIRTHYRLHGTRGLSVWSQPGKPADEIAILAGLPHPVIRVTTVGRVEDAGFTVTEPDARGHCLVVVPGEPTDLDLERLAESFDKPVHNPVTIGERRDDHH